MVGPAGLWSWLLPSGIRQAKLIAVLWGRVYVCDVHRTQCQRANEGLVVIVIVSIVTMPFATRMA